MNTYWQDRAAAFNQIRQLEQAFQHMFYAPQYIGGCDYPEDADDVHENIGPWDEFDRLAKAADLNPTVIEILRAQGRESLLTGDTYDAATRINGVRRIKPGILWYVSDPW